MVSGMFLIFKLKCESECEKKERGDHCRSHSRSVYLGPAGIVPMTIGSATT
jgi:hypothetical protein